MSRRSQAVQLVLFASVIATLDGCGSPPTRRCVDEYDTLADNRNCESSIYGGLHHYHYYYGGPRGYFAPGTRMTGGSASPGEGSGTVRGVFGGAGEGAHESGGGGGGE